MGVLAHPEDGVKGRREGDSGDRRHFLGQQVGDRRDGQRQEDQGHPDRQVEAAEPDVERYLVLPRFRALEAEHQHRHRHEHEAPDHAEGVGFSQGQHVAAAGENRHDLEDHHQVDQPRARAEPGMGLQEPIGQNAVLGDAVQDAVGADDRRVDRPRKDQGADDHHHAVQDQPRPLRPDHVHGQPADQVAAISRHSYIIRDDHHGEKTDERREQHAVEEDDQGRALEVLELGALDLAIDLGQRLLAAHRQDRVSERHDDADDADQAQPVAVDRLRAERVAQRRLADESQGIDLLAERVEHRLAVGVDLLGQVGRRRGQVPGLGADGDRDQAPDDHDDAHDRGRPHDLQGLVARLMDALDVDPPEVDRHQDRDRRREPVLVNHQRAVGAQLEQVVQEADEVLAGRDAADRTGQDVVEQECRHRQPRQPAAHRLLDDAIHAAAHEHGAALDVDAAHAVAEEHHPQDEPGSGLADLRLDDPADVVGRAGQVAKHQGRRPPERDEREHHAGDDQHLSGRWALSLRSRRGDCPGRGGVGRVRGEERIGHQQSVPGDASGVSDQVGDYNGVAARSSRGGEPTARRGGRAETSSSPAAFEPTASTISLPHPESRAATPPMTKRLRATSRRKPAVGLRLIRVQPDAQATRSFLNPIAYRDGHEPLPKAVSEAGRQSAA